MRQRQQSNGVMFLIHCLLFLEAVLGFSSSSASPTRYYVVTGANKGQGLALCQRILNEHDDTHVFLCSRSVEQGQQAVSQHVKEEYHDRIDVVQLDVTDIASIKAAAHQVQRCLENKAKKLHGFVSNAGILWGYSMDELLNVNCYGVRDVLDAFIPLMDSENGRVIVVSTGLSPLMHSYSNHAELLIQPKSWDDIQNLIDLCVQAESNGGDPQSYEAVGFPGGPFAEAAPDFHKYGLAKMFADSYMKVLAKKHPNLMINSCDPGLVYTDLILKMPRYEGKPIDETGAKTPQQGVEVHMRLLFGGIESEVDGSGSFYAINKEGRLMSGDIDKRPDI